MTQQVVDVGSSANDGTGDPIRTSMIKINDNFTEVYTELGGASLSNLSLTGNSIISDDTNGQIILDPNGTGDVIITSGNLGISTSTPVARLEVEDNASTASMLVKITADDQTPWGLIIGNDTFSTTDTDGLSVAVDDAGKASLIVRGASSTLAFGTVATEFMKMDATGQVGITQATPLANLHVTNASSAVTAVTAQQAKGIIIEGSLQAQLTFLNTTSGFGSIAWTDANSATLGEIKYDHNGNILSFTSNTAEVMRFNAAGDMSVGNTNGDYSQLGIVGPVLNVGGADNGWVQTTHTDAANDETVGAFYSADQNGLGSGMSLWRETGNSMLLRLTYRDAGLNVVEGFRLNGLGNV
ncbi:MAG: hypothetical protein HN726_04595, partial [Candidatus Magasanikbacteria bacterium]|nr:hypothetical protein [Candidatus Magasanikbacteria bacterium]